MPPPLRAAARFDISYRPFDEAADLGFIEALYVSTRAEEVAATGWPEEMQKQFLAQQFTAQHSHYKTHFSESEWLIVEQAGAPIGRLYLAEGAEEYMIVDISLMPESRGRGIGAAILEDVIALASSAGKKVSIHVEKNNPARHLYDRLGFEAKADIGVYDLMERAPDPS